MILHLKPDTTEDIIAGLSAEIGGHYFYRGEQPVLVTSASMKEVPADAEPFTQDHWTFEDDIQLAHLSYTKVKREVPVGQVVFGNGTDTVFMTGPCSVESEEQLEKVAIFCKGLGVKIIRAGSYKPRTSPYTFQGLGLEGLQILRKAADRHGLKVITEVRDATHVDHVIELSDIIQIGAKSMYDHGILKACGLADKPVLLKRGFGSTLQEFVQCAEFIMSGGNEQVMLCERGIRTFETKTRFTLDLCGVAWLKETTNLPIVLDPSHAMGKRFGVPDLARACVAMGVDGLLIETHPDPSVALSDAAQQLNMEQTKALYQSLSPVAESIGRRIV